MGELPEEIDGLPNICGSEQRIDETIRSRGTDPVFLPQGTTGFDQIQQCLRDRLAHAPAAHPGGRAGSSHLADHQQSAVDV